MIIKIPTTFPIKIFLFPMHIALLRPNFKFTEAESPEEFLEDLHQESSVEKFGPGRCTLVHTAIGDKQTRGPAVGNFTEVFRAIRHGLIANSRMQELFIRFKLSK